MSTPFFIFFQSFLKECVFYYYTTIYGIYSILFLLLLRLSPSIYSVKIFDFLKNKFKLKIKKSGRQPLKVNLPGFFQILSFSEFILLLAGSNNNFDQDLGACHLGLNASSCGLVTILDPSIPDFVHSSKIIHGLDIDGSSQHVLLVGTILIQQILNLCQNILCLTLDVSSGCVGLTAQINHAIALNASAHTACAFKSFDIHKKYFPSYKILDFIIASNRLVCKGLFSAQLFEGLFHTVENLDQLTTGTAIVETDTLLIAKDLTTADLDMGLLQKELSRVFQSQCGTIDPQQIGAFIMRQLERGELLKTSFCEASWSPRV